MLFQDVVFWALSVLTIGAALGVVLVKDLFRAALLLVIVFISVAGFFVLLSAEFLAVVQVLIYAGAIAILIIFAVMLTRDVQRGNLANRLQVPAATIAALLLAALVVVAVETDWDLLSGEDLERAQVVQTSAVRILASPEDIAAPEPAGLATDQEKKGAKKEALEPGLADLLIGEFVLPFEAVSLLLLAAVIGALVLVRPR